MINLQITQKFHQKIKSGVDLIDEKDINTIPEDGYARLACNGDFVAISYFSPQNKGIGWIVNREDREINQNFWVNLFSLAKEKRSSYFKSPLTNAFRVFNQDGDGFGGLTVDLYNEYALFSWYNPFILSQKEIIVEAFQTAYPEILGAYEKIRFKPSDYESAHLFGEKKEEKFTILENGINYSVFLNDGLMTGIFLDQHEVRDSLIDGLALGKNVLNTFSYTAAFSVAAAAGGSMSTVSVDLAKRSRELSTDNFDANGFDLEANKFVVMDIFEYFKYADRHDLKFDLIILDPPSFARNKKQTFSVAKDYHKLISDSLSILSENGTIIASTNAQNLSPAKFEEQIKKGFGPKKYKIKEKFSLPADFAVNIHDRQSNYLKVYIIEVLK
ncbi:SAM-dependent methyltransferase [Floricoccus penangensis]|uniref:SAM-dependent methyltransferase n=1 Tax=Floricoccus penangensis TaxID=1859475 RepID=A0A9Q5JFN9_9LACT|nr:SAM-dependent methyltransferase [Floricoccus penangensis]